MNKYKQIIKSKYILHKFLVILYLFFDSHMRICLLILEREEGRKGEEREIGGERERCEKH